MQPLQFSRSKYSLKQSSLLIKTKNIRKGMTLSRSRHSLLNKSVVHAAPSQSPPPIQSTSKLESNILCLQPISLTKSLLKPMIRMNKKGKIQGSVIKWKEGPVLGAGSEGTVVKAINAMTGSLFAVKKMFKCKSPQIQKLHQEVQILKDLNHPNIVKYLGSEHVDNIYCIYLQYLPGGSIKNLLSNIGALPEAMCKVYIRQLLSGLIHLHENFIIHRDLKCANLLLDSDGQVRVSDFGSAKKYLSPIESGFATTIRGSLAWTAPEVLTQKGYGRSSDIWSVGCTAIELLTAHPPWDGINDYIALMIKLAKTEELPSIPEFLSKDAHDFIATCLQRDPKKRPLASELINHEFLT